MDILKTTNNNNSEHSDTNHVCRNVDQDEEVNTVDEIMRKGEANLKRTRTCSRC